MVQNIKKRQQPQMTSIISMMLGILLFALPSTAFAVIRDITFPVDSTVTFRDDFGEPRGARTHAGIDIHADKMTPILSATNGVVKYVMIPEPSWGYEISIRDDEGYSYNYIHVNNDTPGTDDGLGGPQNAYVSGIERGVRVTRGQHIGWVGDSGNAENIGAHLHFEMEQPDGTAIDPFESLVVAYAARVPRTPVSTTTTTMSSSTPSMPISVPTYTFTRALTLGSTGTEVKNLQSLLRELGHFDHPSNTGYFGPVTVSAVKRFQKAKGIDQLGIVGPMTRRALNTLSAL